jgi:hypothetical protein
MTDTNDRDYQVDEDTPDDDELDAIDEITEDCILYVEKDTRLIFEVKFFPEFALVRPASPLLYRYIRRVDLYEFGKYFDEFDGDHAAVHDFLNNGGGLEIEVFK